MASPQPRFFASPAEFRHWLEKHAATTLELLVGYWKVGTGRPSMTWSESVDEALCFGWIDSVRRRIDEQAYQIRFTPRQPGSVWSAVNILKFEQLNAQGRMTEAGRRAFANRTEPKSRIYSHEQPQPAELTKAETRTFKAHPQAWAHFEACPPGYRKVLLHWVTGAKKAETRARRLKKVIEASADGKRLR
jgi:uncharacterized protein YdeI (YjbR/CyaY-like superfamily)